MRTTLYTFTELATEAAKERAREWYREGNLDYDWWEYTYEWFETILNTLGIEPKQKVVGYKGGKNGVPRTDVYGPAFYFSGFWSQGDGASWEGDYHYAAGWRKKLAGETSDIELFKIGEALQDIQKRHMYQLHARVYTSGHYSHKYTMKIDLVERMDSKEINEMIKVEDELLDLFRDLAQWLYDRLEEEHEWLNADEQVDESMIVNGYEFEGDGSPA